MADAVVIGAGPNGLVAANLLADAGWEVEVLEAADEPGGAVRSGELTEPGFRHDLFSAFYPLAAASPAIGALDLERHGLRWRRGPLALAHPARDGTCAVLSMDLDETAASLDAFAPGDGDAWRDLYALWKRVGSPFLQALVRPNPPILPTAALAAALGPADGIRFVRSPLLPVRRFAEEHFRGEGGGRLLAGNALHADLLPESAVGGFFGWFLTALGQQVGYPFPEGGAGRLTDALVARLRDRGGSLRTAAAVSQVIVRKGRAVGVRLEGGDEVEAGRAVLADVDAPSLFLRLVGQEHLPARVLDDLDRFQWDNSTVKVDWALEAPIPWTIDEVRRAPVVHLTDGMDELSVQGSELARGLIPSRPFLVFGQYSMGDETRCPRGAEVAWAYTHVPQRIKGDAGGELRGTWDASETDEFAARMEDRVEELAPGFKALIRARHVFTPPMLEEANTNLANGALNGGTAQLHQQLFFRPIPGLGRPETPIRGLYLASSSAHPGGGVHGAPGAIAARAALRREQLKRVSVAVGAAAAATALLRRR